MVFAVNHFGLDGVLHNLALDDYVAFVDRAVDQIDFVAVVVETLKVIDVDWVQLAFVQRRQDA